MSLFAQLFLNSIIAAAIYTLIAVSFTLAFSVTKFFNLAHGTVAVIGAYGAFYITQTLGWGLGFGIVAGVLCAALVGYIADLCVFRSLLNRKASSLVLLVASLGLMTVLQAVVAMAFSSQFQSLSRSIAHQNVYRVFGGSITEVQVGMLLAGLLITSLLLVVLKKTHYGKSVVAISDDIEVAQVIGINTRKVIMQTFVLCSSIAGFAGVLIGLDTGVEPNMGLALLLKGIIAAVIGGIGNVGGAILGALLLGLVENFGIWKISGEWKDAIAFGLLIVFLIFRPKGLIAR